VKCTAFFCFLLLFFPFLPFPSFPTFPPGIPLSLRSSHGQVDGLAKENLTLHAQIAAARAEWLALKSVLGNSPSRGPPFSSTVSLPPPPPPGYTPATPRPVFPVLSSASEMPVAKGMLPSIHQPQHAFSRSSMYAEDLV
jgi:hypothetical protein